MAKPIIVTRLGKGSELSFQEGDDNFTNLKNATVTVAGDSGTSQAIDLNDTVTISGGTGLSSAMTTKTVTLNLDNTAVTPASYTYANITVDQQGRITAASSATTPLVSGGALGTPSSGTLTNCTFPTLNQNTTGSAATLTTPRNINGVAFDGSAAITVTADASTLSGSTLASGVTASSLTSLGTIATGVWNGTSISTTYTDAKVTSVNGSTGAITGLQATSEKNQNNGYAGLDAGGKVASAQLPSYVDDVVEYAAQANFPATGETSKIYVALDNNKIYRWSGSAYVEISASPGSTDAVTEGSTNLYFTNTRARAAFSQSTGITITDGAVAIANTAVTPAAYTYASITVDQQGRITAASSGTAPLVSGGALGTPSSGTVTNLTGTASININGTVGATTPAAVTATTLTSTGRTVIKDLTETVYALTYASTITPDVANGTVQKVTLTGNVTFSAFSNPVAGQSLTLIVTQDGTGTRTLTSTMKFSGAAKTLSTAASSIDIITVFYDGTNYFASLGKGFA